MSNTSQSTDEKEMEHFKILSTDWWNLSKPKVSVLHALNELRVPFICDSLLNLCTPDKRFEELQVLDVGCGGGILSEALGRLGCVVTGVDPIDELITVAKEHAAIDPTLAALTYELSPIEDFASNNPNKYDAVVASEVIEHVPDKRKFLESCVKCLKPGGWLTITTFNATFAAWFIGIILTEYVFGHIPKGTHELEKFISPEEVERILKENNCDVTIVRGMWYNVFTHKWSWCSTKSICYGLQAVKNYN